MGFKVLVIGDVMVDKYIIGDTYRISPEAPIPIVLEKEITYALGGAGNLCHNLRNLGLNIDLLSVVGDDQNGKKVHELCYIYEIKPILTKIEANTITKTRIISRNQQILRIDKEDPPINYEVFYKIPEDIDIHTYDLIVISDYGKGFCNQEFIKSVITSAHRYNKPIFVDPKGKNWSKYKGATLIKPNQIEFEELMDDEVRIDATSSATYQQLLEDLKIKFLIISQGKEGMTLISEDHFYKVEAPKVEVYDVSGAGDTVMATLIYGYLHKKHINEAVDLAVKCGSYVVTKAKTYAITLDELKKLESDSNKT
jgi:D-beta-D-heptose 7-phosphate kinase/D-beta-D-heptose 1-phosphate adenosyltransferase